MLIECDFERTGCGFDGPFFEVARVFKYLNISATDQPYGQASYVLVLLFRLKIDRILVKRSVASMRTKSVEDGNSLESGLIRPVARVISVFESLY